MVYYATLLMGIWALFLIASDDPFGSTPVHSLRFGHRYVTAIILMVACGLALRAIRLRGTLRGWLLMLPQQGLLILSAVGGLVAIASGHYADLEPRPRLFIAADQMPAIVAAFCHSFAIIDLNYRHRIRRMGSRRLRHRRSP
ncbi:MAG: hypothetical protein WD646_15920 [Actinomycetota bacterium]